MPMTDYQILYTRIVDYDLNCIDREQVRMACLLNW